MAGSWEAIASQRSERPLPQGKTGVTHDLAKLAEMGE